MTDISEKIESFFSSNLENEIKEYFGYVERWEYLPLQDCREYYWHQGRNNVLYDTEDFSDKEEACYADELMGEVLRKGDYVLAPLDTRCDHNRYLGIFLASRELKDYRENDGWEDDDF